MDKPEYCWIEKDEALGIGSRPMVAVWSRLWAESDPEKEHVKWRITYNEAGEPVKLERVEG